MWITSSSRVEPFHSGEQKSKVALKFLITKLGEPSAGYSVNIYERAGGKLIGSKKAESDGVALFTTIFRHHGDMYATITDESNDRAPMHSLDFLFDHMEAFSQVKTVEFDFDPEATGGGSDFLKVEHNGKMVAPDIVYKMMDGQWVEVSNRKTLEDYGDERYQQGFLDGQNAV